MIEIVEKRQTGKISDHLYWGELHCRCIHGKCQHTIFTIKTATMFEQLRASCGNRPLTITSGFRCNLHNHDIGGSKLSRHLTGEALDIICPSNMPLDEFKYRAEQIFTFVKSYNNPKRIHCDSRGA